MIKEKLLQIRGDHKCTIIYYFVPFWCVVACNQQSEFRPRSIWDNTVLPTALSPASPGLRLWQYELPLKNPPVYKQIKCLSDDSITSYLRPFSSPAPT